MQWTDWRELRLEDEHSSSHRRGVHDLAKRLANVSQSIVIREEREPEGVSDVMGDEEPGVVELVAVAEEAWPRFTTALANLGEELEHVTGIAAKWSPRVERAATKGAGPALLAFRDLSRELDEPTTRIERFGTEYATELVKIDPAVLSLIRLAEIGQWTDDDARDTFTAIKEMRRAVDEALGQLEELATTLDQTATLSKDLRRPLRRMRAGLKTVLDGRAVIEEWERRVRKVEEGWKSTEEDAGTSSG
jgi:hypothetical protein